MPAMSTPNSFDADVLIVGAGPAGLALGAALADQGLHCTLLEQQPASALADPAEDGREIALTHRARRVMQALGLWERLPADEIAPLQAAHVLDGSSPLVLHFGAGAAAAADAPLGWLVANHLIRRAAWQAAAARPALQVLCEARVQAIERNADAAAVHLADGRVLRGRLLVAADSRFSATRRLAGIGAAMHDFGRSVVVGRVRHERPHGGVAWECFRYGNTLALLPMAGGRRASAVVTVGGERADEWLALSDADFAARIQAQSDGRLGAVQAEGPRHHYPLVGVYAQRFAAPRFALIGDAAVGMHPVTAHGFNFGLHGVDLLSREILAATRVGTDIAAPERLHRFETAHRRATRPLYLATQAIATLYTDDRGPARLVRRLVLDASSRIGPLRLAIATALSEDGLSLRGLLPRLG